jgi:hypothetical protein
MLKAPNKMLLDHFKPAMAFHKRRPKMKDDHIACLPYALPRCTTVKIHWYRHAMRQIENFDFDPQNKIRICCLARSLQARSLRQQKCLYIKAVVNQSLLYVILLFNHPTQVNYVLVNHLGPVV